MSGKIKSQPFQKTKSVVHKTALQSLKLFHLQGFAPNRLQNIGIF
jgi:hypothetical protein